MNALSTRCRWHLMIYRVAHTALLLALFSALNGCAWLVKPPSDDGPARQWVEQFSRNNQELKQFKGLARIRLQTGDQTISGRVAWAAAAPERLRVEWLNMMGQPLTSLVSDGQTITIASHGDRNIHRMRQDRTALEPLIQVPIGVEDLVDLLAGRAPLPPFTAAQVVAVQDDIYTVVLKNRWHSTLARLEFDQRHQQIKNLQTYDTEGALRYKVNWAQWQSVGGRTVPRQVEVTAAGRGQVTLTVDRFWTDVDLPPSIFELTLPDQTP